MGVNPHELDNPLFKLNDKVKVLESELDTHHRTPWFIKGKVGKVDAIYDTYLNPEQLAYGHDGTPKQYLYRIEFEQTLVWDSYDGQGNDKLCVDIFEHWLESI